MSALPSPDDGGEMAAHDNVGSKRYRRPSVRLGEIGGEKSSFDQRKLKSLWKDSSKNNRHRTNLSSNQTLALVDTNPNESSNSRKNWSNVDEEDTGDANLDDVTIGSWKSRNLKSKKGPPVTKKMRSAWTPKVNDSEKDDKMLSVDVEDLENNENSADSPVHSHDNNKTNNNVNMGAIDIDRRIDNVNSRKRAIRVSEDGPTDTETRDWNRGSERNEVKVWLNQLALGHYASVFEIHEVDDEVLPMLTLEDLKDMGITAVGSRRKMYSSIQNLNKGFS